MMPGLIWRGRFLCGCGFQGLIDVCLDVIDMLDAHGEADVIGGSASFQLLLRGELLVGGGSGMNHEALCVADVGEVREEFHRIDEFFTGFKSALDAETDDAAEAALEIF